MRTEAAERADFQRLRYAQCWEDADILWMIRYRGSKSFRVDPQWFTIPQDWGASANVTVEDPIRDLAWVALFKGGIWGVRGRQAFLLLPQPDYKGSEMMELSHDWLLIHGDTDKDLRGPPRVIARFNVGTHVFHLKRRAETFYGFQ